MSVIDSRWIWRIDDMTGANWRPCNSNFLVHYDGQSCRLSCRIPWATCFVSRTTNVLSESLQQVRNTNTKTNPKPDKYSLPNSSTYHLAQYRPKPFRKWEHNPQNFNLSLKNTTNKDNHSTHHIKPQETRSSRKQLDRSNAPPWLEIYNLKNKNKNGQPNKSLTQTYKIQIKDNAK